jgi:tetratricopeptide (TPR) repeat protein
VFSVHGFSQKKDKKKEKNGKTEITEEDRSHGSDLFVRAISQRELGNMEKSMDMFLEATEINPEDDAAFYELARVLQAMGRNDEAMVYAKTAIELDSENKWYKVLYGNLAKANGQIDEYVKVYEELVAEYPRDLNFLNQLAFAYFFIGDYQQSIDVYQDIEEIVGVNEALTTQKVQLYNQLGQKEKAVEEYEKLIEIDPDESRYYALLAEYCAKNGLDDKAIWAYEKIVEVNPEDPYVHISLAEFYKKKGEEDRSFEELKLGLANPGLDLKTKINLLFAYYSGELTEKQKKQALELSEVLRETHPDDPMSETFYASMLYENKEYEGARDILREIIKEEKGNYGLWEQLLFCNLYMEDYNALSGDSEEAIDLFPTYPLPYFFAGIGNFQLKDFVKARAYLESGKEYVVNNNPLLEQFYSSLGDTYNELKMYDASYEAYDNALRINPENSVVLNNYAYYLSLRSEKLEKAAQMSKKSIDLDPYNHNNLDTHAWVLYQLEKFDDALEWIEKAYRNGGDDSGVVLEHYGDILFKLGRQDEALEYWENAKTKSDYSELLDKKIKDKELYE